MTYVPRDQPRPPSCATRKRFEAQGRRDSLLREANALVKPYLYSLAGRAEVPADVWVKFDALVAEADTIVIPDYL